MYPLGFTQKKIFWVGDSSGGNMPFWVGDSCGGNVPVVSHISKTLYAHLWFPAFCINPVEHHEVRCRTVVCHRFAN